MAKQANRMMIGGFVVVAVFLLAASIVVFGSGKLFKKTNLYVMYFTTSIKGLNVGAPVLFQGVPIGAVKSIVIRTDADNMKTEIPIVIEVEEDQFEVVGETKRHKDYREELQVLIDLGLRAVLSMQSLITGQLLIELDFYPHSPAVLRQRDLPYPEVPTIPSTTERLVNTLQKLDLEALQKHLESTLTGIDALVNNPDLKTSLKEIRELLVDARGLVRNVDGRFANLVDDFDATLKDSRELIDHVDSRVTSLSDNVNRTVVDIGELARNADRQLTSVAERLDHTLASASGVLSEEAPVVVELEDALREIAVMARAFRELAAYLEQHPEALLQGKGSAGGK